jgi:hypothetical protein
LKKKKTKTKTKTKLQLVYSLFFASKDGTLVRTLRAFKAGLFSLTWPESRLKEEKRRKKKQ